VTDIRRQHIEAAPSPARGATLILLAGVGLSFGGLIVRNITVADDWQIVFYRSTVSALGLLILIALRDRRDFWRAFHRSGWPGLCASLSISVALVTFILSVNATSVANTLFVLAAAPFMAAVLGWLLLRERVDRATWIAMSVALAGVAIMVWHGMTGGSLYGNAMALLTALGFAGFTVALRFGRQSDMMPTVCIAGGISAAVAAIVVMASGNGFGIPLAEIGLCALYGGLIAIGLTIFTVGGRAVAAAVLALLSLTEVLLGPVWVWLFLGEVPHVTTLIGGCVLLAAIVGQAAASLRRD
jgi:drug/metabolite transporter (DMT)-like permease